MNRTRLGAFAGVSAAIFMTVGWVLAGLLQGGEYDWSTQEISDLGALTADSAWVWNTADSLSGLLLVLLAYGLLPLVRSTRAGHLGIASILVVGVGSILDGVLREDCPLSTSAACQQLEEERGLSWHHQAHNLESILVVAAMLVSTFAFARAFRTLEGLRKLAPLSQLTGIALVTFVVAYLALYGNAGAGIAQRFLALGYMAWIAVVSVAVLRKSTVLAGGR